ncbi:TPA: hypothetical protein N0F65_010899 [Lagenidium giganteum]|uniref:Uncharacterized protein n=1 Tax=Lagenidium giganteum TaxID=4803 RepID=A0AAV2YD02_9STRA|nr:TPA: hypothetical protein N0F65_010899 [Lagenidium giganteum]
MENRAVQYNVRELLELERNLYQQSIEQNEGQHRDLLAGRSDDYAIKCIPFEQERDTELEVANVHFQLNKRNAMDLLEFELKQADDVFQDERRQLKNRLLSQARSRLENLQESLEELKRGSSRAPLVTQSNGSDNKSSYPHRRASKPDVQNVMASDGVVRKATLFQELEESLQWTQEAYNMNHLVHCIPTPQKVVDSVSSECENLKVRWQKLRRLEPSQYTVIIKDSRKEIACGSKRRWFCGDLVVLFSFLSQEEFHGQIADIMHDEVHLLLACGTPMTVPIKHFCEGKCSLRPPLASSSPTAVPTLPSPRTELKRGRKRKRIMFQRTV